jgi:hypothetical protein
MANDDWYYIAASITALLAVAAWTQSTVPFLKRNGEDVDPDYSGWLIGIVTHFFFALIVGVSYKRQLPLGVYVHGLLVVSTVAFLIAAYSNA